MPVPLQSPILTVSGNLPGRSVVIAKMLCDKIAAEADAFTHTRWRKIVFTFPGVRESRRRSENLWCSAVTGSLAVEHTRVASRFQSFPESTSLQKSLPVTTCLR